jgi:hypothetical protein
MTFDTEINSSNAISFHSDTGFMEVNQIVLFIKKM